ncbi:MAG: hypothetical protein AAFV88_12265 [Planctomycetota bacterium]
MKAARFISNHRLAGATVRALYLFSMYTGIRALANRLRSRFLPDPRASLIDGVTLEIDDAQLFGVRVHARACDNIGDEKQVGGMISVYLKQPGIPWYLYSLLRVSSHFGCGHIEVAFSESDGRVCIYAIRNMLRSNLNRVGLASRMKGLSLGTEEDEIQVLTGITEELRSNGLKPCLASPAECVSRAVSPWLLKSETRDRAMTALTRKYERLAKRVVMDHSS